MTQLEGVILLVGLCGSLVLAGYWLAALTAPETTAAERLAIALLAGLGSLLLLVSLVNYFLPLSLPWALLCLLPILLSVAWNPCRRALWSDVSVFCRDRETRLAGVLIGAFLVLLLAGLVFDSRTVLYDGSPNHDSFFWVTAAEHLKRNSYMVAAMPTPTQPMSAATNSIIGWKPVWGRMGTEGLLALTSSLIGASPVKIYLYGTATLFLVWVAAVYLTAKTFFQTKLTRPALVGLALFQPLFVFYYANSNLPNLLGALAGAGAVLGTERALRAPLRPAGTFLAWCGLIVLSLHGLCCSYPEMIPFIGLSCGLLWLRPWFARPVQEVWRAGLLVAAAGLLSFAVNPASTLRAWHGFLAVLGIARANETYANLFRSLEWGEWTPAFFTLAIPASGQLGFWLGAPLSLLLLGGCGLALWRAQDRFGTLAIFAGSLFLFIYTLATGFAYGWQKTVQFGGVFIATLAPVMTLDSLLRIAPANPRQRRLVRGATAAIMLFFGYATAMSWADVHKWSQRKRISADWFKLRELSRDQLRQASVLVEPATFRMAFYHGMWAAYFLPESPVYFASRGEQNGGYLRELVVRELEKPIPSPTAYLVGRTWADSFDANSPRILTGREFALLQKCNRVFVMTGVQPLNGPPDTASDLVRFDIQPHSPGHLLIDLAPRRNPAVPSGSWRISRRASGTADFSAEVEGMASWQLKVPLAAGQRNEVVLQFEHAGAPLDVRAFLVRDLRIEDAP